MKFFKPIIFIFCFLIMNSALADTYEKAMELFDNNAYPEATAILLKLKESEDSVDINASLSRLYVNQNDLKNAVKYAEAALQIDPKSADAHYMFGVSKGLELANSQGGIFKKLGAVKKVRRAFETAIQLEPENISARSGLAQLHIMLPGIAGGSKKKALHQANEIYKLDKIKAYPLLAQIYQAQKKTKKTREILVEWLAAQPNEWTPIMAFAYFETEQKNYAAANEIFNSWLTQHPNDNQVKYQIGKLAVISGLDLDDGLKNLIHYIENTNNDMQPKKEYAYWRIAQIYQQQQNFTAAKSAIKAGLELDPDNSQLLELRNSLKNQP